MNISTYASGRRFGLVVTALAAVALSGCGGSGLPSTYSGSGKVVFKGGDIKQLEGGTIEFQLISEPSIVASSEIKADGSFSLTSYNKEGKSREGIVAGEHKVRVEPPNSDEGTAKRIIDTRFWTFEKSGLKITIPSDKGIVVEVSKPGI